MALNFVSITGTFDDGSQSPLSGKAVFTPSETVYASGVPVVSADNPITVSITGGSLGAVKLLATDNAGLSFAGLTGFFFWSVTITLGGISQQGWSFFLPSSPTTVDLYALANTAAGGGFTNPMTALGDMITGGAAGAAARLAGNASAAKEFLTSTGTGTAANTPAWGTIAASDVPTLNQSTTGTAGNVTGIVAIAHGGTGQITQQAALDALAGAVTSGRYLRGDGTNVVLSAVQPADLGTTPGTTPASMLPLLYGGVWGYPWQFLPESYGGEGFRGIAGDIVTNSTNVITSASGAFATAVAGDHILIHGANGATSGPLITTIASVQSATQVTLSAAASASVSNCPAIWGPDATSAWVSAANAAGAYGIAHDYFGEVLAAPIPYILAGAPTQTGNGTTTPTFNAQIPLSFPAANGSSEKLVIALSAMSGDAGYVQYWESLVPNVAGCSLVSLATTGNTPDPVFGQQSVIGGPSSGSGFTGSFANVKVTTKGVGVWLPVYTNIYAYDFGYLSAMRVQQSSAHIFAPPGVGGGVGPVLKDLPPQAAFQNAVGAGLRSPVIGNNADAVCDDFTVEGYSRGLYVFDHFTGHRVFTIYNDVALKIDLAQGISGVSHGVAIDLFGCEVYNGGISVNGNTYCPVYIRMDAECTGVAYDVNDIGNALYGEIRWTDPADSRSPVVNGAGNLRFINDKLGPGHWASAPGVPLSGTPQRNTSFRDASALVVHTGAGVTVSAITVDGTSTGLTMGAGSSLSIPPPPSGKSVTLTYAGGTPTWDWWLT